MAGRLAPLSVYLHSKPILTSPAQIAIKQNEKESKPQTIPIFNREKWIPHHSNLRPKKSPLRKWLPSINLLVYLVNIMTGQFIKFSYYSIGSKNFKENISKFIWTLCFFRRAAVSVTVSFSLFWERCPVIRKQIYEIRNCCFKMTKLLNLAISCNFLLP